MYCRHCGNELSNDDKFCSKCGTMVDSNDSNMVIDAQGDRNDDNKKSGFDKKLSVLVGILLICGILIFIAYIGNSNSVITPTDKSISNNNKIASYNKTNDTSVKKKLDIKDPDTYITNNPIAEQTSFYPDELVKYSETYNTRDILALMTAEDYVKKERNVYKIRDITLCQRDDYGRYRIMVVYYTPVSKFADTSVVYVYMSQKDGGARMFFEYNTLLPNTSEWNTPLSF